MPGSPSRRLLELADGNTSFVSTTPTSSQAITAARPDDNDWIKHYLADLAARIINAKAESKHYCKQLRSLETGDPESQRLHRMIYVWRERLADLRGKRACWTEQLTASAANED